MRSPGLDILGPFPPPYGGVSVHVRRLQSLVRAEGLPIRVFSTAGGEGAEGVTVVGSRPYRFLAWYFIHDGDNVLYLATARLGVWIYGAVLAVVRGRRVVIRLQNDVVVKKARLSLHRAVGAWALRRAVAVVGVNEELCRTAADMGASSDRIWHLPGFLPPDPAELAPDDLDIDLRGRLDGRWPILVANGRVEFVDDLDLYGFDLLVEAAVALLNEHPRLQLVIVLWEYVPDRDDAYLAELNRRATLGGLEGALHICEGRGPLLPLLRRADVVVRPTCTDGDANSVREALWLDRPVVASDAVSRPVGATVVKSRDPVDLARGIREALIGAPRRGRGVESDERSDSAEESAGEYRRFIRSLVLVQT